MRFEQALMWMRNGYKVTRAAWKNRPANVGGRRPISYLRLAADGKVWRCSRNQEIEFVLSTLNAQSLMAEDWEIVDASQYELRAHNKPGPCGN